MKRERERRPQETEDEKLARWQKLDRAARTFSKVNGIDLRKVKAERERNERERRLARGY